MSLDYATVIESTFGVELEIADTDDSYVDTTIDRIANKLRNAFRTHHPDQVDMVIPWGNSTTGRHWVVKDDGSCGYEITSPAMTWATFPQLELVADTLDSRYIVNENCGLHVHHQASFTPREIRRLVLYWAVMERALLNLVDSGRASNDYCAPFTALQDSYDFDDGEEEGEPLSTFSRFRNQLVPVTRMRSTLMDLGRYVNLNLTNWWRTGLVEVRLHHGTLNSEEIRHWVALTQFLIHAFAKSSLRLDQIVKLGELSHEDTHRHLVEFIRTNAPNRETAEYLITGMKRRIKTYYGRTLTKLLENCYA